MTNLFKKPFLLHNSIQHYHWGTRNQDAYIPRLLGDPIKPDTPYAELWIGAHPGAPSKIEVENELLPLNELVHRFPRLLLGTTVADHFDNTLPFLCKVLSVAESLSIQAHPSKQQAALLHKADPQHYPDNNHKPEIAIALSSVTAFAGFDSYNTIRKSITIYPEIAQFFGNEALAELFPGTKLSRDEQIKKIRQLYQNFIQLTQTKSDLYQTSVSQLAIRLAKKNHQLSYREKLFLESFEKYGSADVGLFSIFFLRIVKLKPGEAICLTNGLPHAYLKGNLIECMANSDNVIRAGLTPKYQDVAVLMTILNYSPYSNKIAKPEISHDEIHYPVFTPEFKISRFTISQKSKTFSTGGKIELLLAVGGNGTIQWNPPKNSLAFSRGQSFLIPAQIDKYTIQPTNPLILFRVQIP